MLIRKKLFGFGVVAALLGCLAVGFWPQQRPNLLLITLDTTRADRLGCYGYSKGRTPVLDGLAGSGVLCERAYTVAPLTLPAHASLFTGLYPAENGVRTNGRGRLDDTIPTLAEVLKEHGYDTAGFVASFVLNGIFGLDRGFKEYDDAFVGEEPGSEVLHRQRPGAAVVDAVLEWLGKRRPGPFFCWVHLYDPHAPYLSHSECFGDEFAERPYDGEIAYVDRQVGRLLEFLQSGGLESRTLVVVVGDHGEGLGEHIERTHGATLYDATMRVPLIFHYRGHMTPGRRVAANVSLVDISPTILDLLELPDRRKITGKSIRRGLMGSELPPAACYGATDEPFLANGWSPLRCLTEARWKYIRTTRPELYDLASDPQERENLAESEPEKTQEMEGQLAELESRLLIHGEVEVQLSAAERRALASLGYAGGAAGTAPSTPPAILPDIKDMLPFDIAVDEAENLIKQGSVDAAIARLREVVKQVPSHTLAHLCLGIALRDRSEFDEAIEVLYALVTSRPDCRDGHYGLGLVLLDKGQNELAIQELTRSLEIDPDFAEAHYYLAKEFARTGQVDEALAHFDAALQIDRFHVNAWQLRAQLQGRLGRIDAAIADFKSALKCVPNSAEVHHNLGRFLADHGYVAEARQHLVRAAELSPRSAEIQFALGEFLLRQEKYDDAIDHLARSLELRPGHRKAEELMHRARQAAKD